MYTTHTHITPFHQTPKTMELQKERSSTVRPASPGSSFFHDAEKPTTHDDEVHNRKRSVKTVQVLPAEPCRPKETSLKSGTVPQIRANQPIDASDPPTPTIENADSAISTESSSLSWNDRLCKHKHRMLKRLYWLQLVFITSSMAAAETTNKGVLAACIFSVVAGAMLDLTARGYVAGAGLFWRSLPGISRSNRLLYLAGGRHGTNCRQVPRC